MVSRWSQRYFTCLNLKSLSSICDAVFGCCLNASVLLLFLATGESDGVLAHYYWFVVMGKNLFKGFVCSKSLYIGWFIIKLNINVFIMSQSDSARFYYLDHWLKKLKNKERRDISGILDLIRESQ